MKIDENPLEAHQSQAKTLNKLREVATLAISVTSGKKFNIQGIQNKERQSYIIPGFGYSMLDLFENGNINMDDIIKKDTID
jgi:hypothetical protein